MLTTAKSTYPSGRNKVWYGLHCARDISLPWKAVSDLRRWMISNMLMVNASKTDFLIVGSKQQLECVSIPSNLEDDQIVPLLLVLILKGLDLFFHACPCAIHWFEGCAVKCAIHLLILMSTLHFSTNEMAALYSIHNATMLQQKRKWCHNGQTRDRA